MSSNDVAGFIIIAMWLVGAFFDGLAGMMVR